MPNTPAAALVVLFSLVSSVAPNPLAKNNTVTLLAPGVDPCAIDPALCAPGASQESESSEAADCSSQIRRGSVMLNLHARAAALQMVHAVVVFPGSSETERVKTAILLAERLNAGHLFLAGSSEAAVDEVHAWTYGKVVATRAALGFQRVDKNTTAPYNIEVQKVAADATEQAEQAVAYFTSNPDILSAVLVGTSWHLPRAYMTLVAKLMADKEQGLWPAKVLPTVAVRQMGQNMHLVSFDALKGKSMTPRDQYSAAEDEQLLLAQDTARGVAATDQVLEDYLKVIDAWW